MNASPSPNDLLRAKYQKNVANSRVSLITVVVMTVVSMFTLAFMDVYFLFSAYLPFSFFSEGFYGWQIANGTFAHMDELAAEDIAYYTELGNFGLIFGIVVALMGVLGYFICWLLSKKHPAAVIVGTVFFAIDCVALLLDAVTLGSASMFIDIAFHAYIMYTLVAGVIANSKLKKLPAPIIPIEGEASVVEEVPTVVASADNTDSSEQN